LTSTFKTKIFSRNDEQLDEVAGGFKDEIQKDIKFLNAMGVKLEKIASEEDVDKAWQKMGVVTETFWDADKSVKNDYYQNGVAISRQEAMIEAMRKTKKFVDLDQYL